MQGSCNDACCPPSIQTDYSIRATCQTDCQHTRRWVPEAGRPAQWHKAVQTLFSVMVPHAIPLVEPLRWGDPRLQVTMGANGGSGCGGFAWASLRERISARRSPWKHGSRSSSPISTHREHGGGASREVYVRPWGSCICSPLLKELESVLCLLAMFDQD